MRCSTAGKIKITELYTKRLDCVPLSCRPKYFPEQIPIDPATSGALLPMVGDAAHPDRRTSSRH